MADTIKDLRVDLHAVDKRLATLEAVSEERHEALLAAIADLRKDLSDQGRTPEPTDRAPAPPPRTFGLLPGTGRELAIAAVSIVTLLGGVGGISFLGAQSGGNTGAATAVETAVERAEAVPIAAPVTRVVPVPVPVPVPVEPEPPVVEDDLMRLHP